MRPWGPSMLGRVTAANAPGSKGALRRPRLVRLARERDRLGGGPGRSTRRGVPLASRAHRRAGIRVLEEQVVDLLSGCLRPMTCGGCAGQAGCRSSSRPASHSPASPRGEGRDQLSCGKDGGATDLSFSPPGHSLAPPPLAADRAHSWLALCWFLAADERREEMSTVNRQPPGLLAMTRMTLAVALWAAAFGCGRGASRTAMGDSAAAPDVATAMDATPPTDSALSRDGASPTDGALSRDAASPADGAPPIDGTDTDTAPVDADTAQDSATSLDGASTCHAILQGGQDTGFDSCDDGTVRRRAVVTCPDNGNTTTTNPCPTTPGAAGYCGSDAECTAMPLGYCANARHLAGYCGCFYGCMKDADCGVGTICRCGVVTGQCVPASCTSGATCGAGRACITTLRANSPTTCSLINPGFSFACQTAADMCGGDRDCGPSPGACLLIDDHRVCGRNFCPV